ncbi:unnamed protein product [Adineta steineri]|uniref:Uncharacterized protein n=1 Tax=Adineta steineri TaxID=433720 RepID=A0A814E176_9BILA|nr:unnamed protein product [Adineta steineri]CAF0917173.1 unnamed protein product [Adineta steineri]CAF0961523.1 unnamed protein product [Adineta steineri]
MPTTYHTVIQSAPPNNIQCQPIIIQPYTSNNPSVIVIHQEKKDVQHGCHFFLWFLSGGLWTPCWLAACFGCCCERPC